jgi:RNA-binding protein YlmH
MGAREDHQPGARACQSSQAGEAAAMIEFAEFEEFRYSEPQWSELKAVVLNARLDVVRSCFR